MTVGPNNCTRKPHMYALRTYFILIHARNHIILFFHPDLFGLPCLSIIPIIFTRLLRTSQQKITKVGVVSPQLFFHLQVTRILLIFISGSCRCIFSLLSTGFSKYVTDCITSVVDYFNELRVPNHPLTIFLGSLFL